MGTYNLIILGGGPAGYYAAERASDAGLKTLLFEERNLGGVCLNEGCIPTKSYLYTAKTALMARHGNDCGVCTDNIAIDQAKALEYKNKAVKRLVGGVASALKQRKVDAIKARGIIKGRSENGFLIEANNETYASERLLICTGSEVFIPPIEGVHEALESGFAITSREILDMETIPANLVIIGAGVIALELANYFAVCGANVTVLVRSRVIRLFDKNVGDNLRKNLEMLGVNFLEAKPVGLANGEVRVRGKDGDLVIPADKVLLSIGRIPQVKGYGFDKLDLYLKDDAIVTDAHMRTNVPGVWAAGDVNGKVMLAHTAYREAAVAINDMIGAPDIMHYDAIPEIIYTIPEVGRVGETEESAVEKGYIIDKVTLPLQYSGRYVCENYSGDGFVKIIADRRTGRILGIHVIGNYASEIILSAAILVGSKYTTETAEKIVYPHPTVGEILRDAFTALNNAKAK